MGIGKLHQSRTVGSMLEWNLEAEIVERRNELPKAMDLQQGVGLISAVSSGKVGKQTLDLQTGKSSDGLHLMESSLQWSFHGQDSETSHPGVHLDVDSHLVAVMRSLSGKRFTCCVGEDCLGQVVVDQDLSLVGRSEPEDQDRCHNAGRTKLQSLLEAGHTQGINA